MFCDECESGGTLCSGLPGVLANGERCDTCQRVPTDAMAKALLCVFNTLQTPVHELNQADLDTALVKLYSITCPEED